MQEYNLGMSGAAAADEFVGSVWSTASCISDFCEGHAFDSLKILFNPPESAGSQHYFVYCLHSLVSPWLVFAVSSALLIRHQLRIYSRMKAPVASRKFVIFCVAKHLLNLFEADRRIVPDIDADIDLFLVLLPAQMHMTV